jgi:hypothetical protein
MTAIAWVYQGGQRTYSDQIQEIKSQPNCDIRLCLGERKSGKTDGEGHKLGAASQLHERVDFGSTSKWISRPQGFPERLESLFEPIASLLTPTECVVKRLNLIKGFINLTWINWLNVSRTVTKPG